MSQTAIILAAGKSTRMKSRLPKVLHEVCGKPMLEYVVDACVGAGCHRLLIVVGHGKEAVMERFSHEKRITWVEQTEQLGTGHAAQMCQKHLNAHSGDVFILAGDGPLIRGEVLDTLLKAHRDDKADATMATAMLDDPTGYGRVVRDAEGNFVEIVEQIDCTPEQREIREVFPSYYCIKAPALLLSLGELKNENKKGEYYLTDIYGILRQHHKRVLAVQAVTADDTLAVNTRDQQAQVDAVMQERIQRNLREAGVGIPSPATTYIEAGVRIGSDTILRPFTFIGRDATVGAHCNIGPFASIPRDGIVPDGTTVTGNVRSEFELPNRSIS